MTDTTQTAGPVTPPTAARPPAPVAPSAPEPTAPAVSPRRLKLVLGLEHLVANLGRFTLLPVLGVLLLAQDRTADPAAVGTGLLIFTAASGLSGLLANRYLSRVRYTTALAGSMLLVGLGFGILPYVHQAPMLLIGLLVAGFGISIHALLATVLVAEAIPDDVGRHKVFSLFQIAGNAAAAAGPFIATALYVSVDGRPLLAFVSAAYVITAVLLAFGLPQKMYPPATTTRWPIGRETFLAAVRIAGNRRIISITVIGAFIYAQFYSAFALYVAYEVSSAPVRSALLAGPAVFIVLLQAPVTGIIARLMRRGLSPFGLLGAGSAIFGVAMLLLGAGWPIVIGAGIAVTVFSLAEMVFQPMVSTAFAGLALKSRLEAFGLRQISWTAGEALGSLCGGTAFLLFHNHAADRLYWLILAAVTLLSTAALMLPRGGATRMKEMS